MPFWSWRPKKNGDLVVVLSNTKPGSEWIYIEYFSSSAFCTEHQQQNSRSHQRREPEKGILDDGDAWKKVCQTKSSGRLERARNRKAILGGASKGTSTRSTMEGDLEQMRISASVHASTDRHRISCRPSRSLLRATGSAANASDDDDEGALFFIVAVPAMEGF